MAKRGKRVQARRRDKKRQKRFLGKKVVRSLLTPTGTFWTSVTIVLSVVGTYYLFKTKVVIEDDKTRDPQNPLVTPFRITNGGLLTIYDVRPSCEIRLLEASNITVKNVAVINATPTVPKLRPGEPVTVMIPTFPNPIITTVPKPPFGMIDVDVRAKYKTPLGKQKDESARFAVMVSSDGSYQWYRRALSEP